MLYDKGEDKVIFVMLLLALFNYDLRRSSLDVFMVKGEMNTLPVSLDHITSEKNNFGWFILDILG